MKKLIRSNSDRKLSGVLGGLAKYTGIDASLLRVLFVILLIFTGFFPLVLIYAAWIFVVPEESDVM
ncbi:PspC domain-containing protein [Metabacillus sediminilitoris]|jgi:phage shock protein PspC (stress-responsive transcriptional regulator)|uniref:PspC domain-containing protein n=1 Tax=Metabacillus sediminilitoris TaxID=2567941 RepID=A0A4S4C1P4_9BACI|nr:PspC domain-containing protein [Metabacillus sediminilitoris]QGQ48066.1 PspC domain-containing protein [Metabacillus sediminilitoris]THF81571.1 PspC domain-containing protein [Metabacillus sediminilitoris]